MKYVVAALAAVILAALILRRRSDEATGLFGNEKAELIDGVKRAIDALARELEGKTSQFLRPDQMRHPLLINLSLLALLDDVEAVGTPTTRLDVAEALAYMRLSSAAYGSIMLAALGDSSSAGVVPASENEDVAIAVACKAPTAELLMVATSRPGVPAHFVARLGSKIVVCVRGTRGIDDAVTDMIATSADAPELGGRAHAGIRDAARRVATGKAADLAGRASEIVVAGHSLGAGVAALLALEFARNWPDKKVDCYCFAPPPVATRAPKLPNCDVRVVVNDNDCVPSLSLASVAELLVRAANVDALSLTLRERVALIANQDARALKGVVTDGPSTIAPLALVGDVFHIRGRELLTPPASLFDRITVHRRMILDHFPHNYEYALARLLV
ncbi:hypothetical protein CTAYLR_002879 [Chrysophaeum taylorii]|uniref:sn-1-specific diacylglycerol lipase n=1 Tax=Chrysophaeum taylorii TaxID=2483200 RepID=A0AAD7U7Y1_9STRA|nr:hypothetical protein CTAYLR_002879 [Chrysophaeum taylorii]